MSRCSLGNGFLHQHGRSEAQPCAFCKCYLHALVVLTHTTEFIKLLLWPLAMLMQVGEECSDQLMEKHRVSWSILLLKDAQGVECLIEVNMNIEQMKGETSCLGCEAWVTYEEVTHAEE